MDKNIKHTVCRTFSWSRYRFRLWKRLEDIPRDFNDWRKICFKHRVEQSLCHCKDGEYHFAVTPKIAIPKRCDIKGWQKLEAYLMQNGDNPEYNNHSKLIPTGLLSQNERLILKVVGDKPKRSFFKK
jgi:hypothetical protein